MNDAQVMGRDMSDHVAPAPGYPAAKKPPLREGAKAAAGNAGGVGGPLPHNPYRMAADAATDDAETSPTALTVLPTDRVKGGKAGEGGGLQITNAEFVAAGLLP